MTDTLSDLQFKLVLDETSGTTLADSSGRGNDATLFGTGAGMATQQAFGPGNLVPGGVEFTAASDQYAEIPAIPLTTAYTVSGWVKTSDTAAILYDYRDADNDGLLVEIVAGALVVRHLNADQTTVVVNNNAWRHWGVTFNGTDVRVYVDGALVANVAGGGNLAVSAVARIGSASFGTPAGTLDGTVADPRAYDRALTGLDVAAVFREGRTIDDGCIVHLDQPPSSGTVWRDELRNNEQVLANPTFEGTGSDPQAWIPANDWYRYTFNSSSGIIANDGQTVTLTFEDLAGDQNLFGLWDLVAAPLNSTCFVEMRWRLLEKTGAPTKLKIFAVGGLPHNTAFDFFVNESTPIGEWQVSSGLVRFTATSSLFVALQSLVISKTVIEIEYVRAYAENSFTLVGGKDFADVVVAGPLDQLPLAANLQDGTDHLQGPILLAGASQFSVGFFAKKATTYSLTQTAFSLNTGSASTSFYIWPGDSSGGNGTRVYFNGANRIDINDSLLDVTKWNHYCVVYNGATLSLYENRVLVAEAAYVSTVAANAAATFGTSNDTQYFRGAITSARIWDRVISLTEIDDHFDQGQTLLTGLVGEWLLDEATGTTAFDTSGNGNDGTYTGGVTLRETGPGGRHPWAAGFVSASSQHVSTAADIAVYPVSIGGWIRQDAAAVGTVASLALTTAANKYFSLGVSAGGKPTVVRSNTTANTITGVSDIADGEWHHLLAVMESATKVRLYVDGLADTINEAATSVALAAADADQFLIGELESNVGSGYFPGDLAVIRAWNIALDEEDAMALWLEKNRRGVGGVFGPRRSVVCRTSFPVHQLPLQ